MDISKEQIEQLKEQVLNQINSTFPADKKDSAIQQINEMNDEQFIQFLEQNNLIKTPSGENTEGSSDQASPFRQIIQGSIPSHTPSVKKVTCLGSGINSGADEHPIIIRNIINDNIKDFVIIGS